MDNLTHSLTGLMLSRAGLNRFYPRATLVLVIAANIPDIDIRGDRARPALLLRAASRDYPRRRRRCQ